MASPDPHPQMPRPGIAPFSGYRLSDNHRTLANKWLPQQSVLQFRVEGAHDMGNSLN